MGKHTRIEPFANFWANVPASTAVTVKGTADKRGRNALRLGTVRTVTDHMGTPVQVNVTGSGGPLCTPDRDKLNAFAQARRDATLAKRSLRERRRAAGIAGRKTRTHTQRAEIIEVRGTSAAYKRMAEHVRAEFAKRDMQPALLKALREIDAKYTA